MADTNAFPIFADFLTGSALMAEQEDYNKKAQDRAFQQNLDAQSIAPRNYATALQSAGLPLSLAMRGAFQTATAPSPLPVQTPSTNFGSNFAALQQAAAQTKLVEAQAANLEADTTAKEIENTRKRDEDYSFDSNIRGQLESWSLDDSNPARQAAANLMLDSNELFTKGTADGIKLWNSVVDSNDQLATDMVVREFTRLLKSEMRENGALSSLADVPNYDIEKFAREIILLEANASKVSSETDVNKARLAEISANVRDMIESADLKYSDNLVKQYKNKDRSAVFINLTGKAINAVAAGAGFGVGSRLAGPKAPKAAKAKDVQSNEVSLPPGWHDRQVFTKNKRGFVKENWHTPFPAPSPEP